MSKIGYGTCSQCGAKEGLVIDEISFEVWAVNIKKRAI